METSLKGLVLAAEIFITCVLISFSLLLMREGKNLGNTFLKELKEEERLYGENKWTRYEGSIISGAELINVIKRYQKVLKISVDNLIRPEVYSKENLFLIAHNDEFSLSYIEPFDDYIGEVLRKRNGEIGELSFRKRR